MFYLSDNSLWFYRLNGRLPLLLEDRKCLFIKTSQLGIYGDSLLLEGFVRFNDVILLKTGQN